MGEQLPGRQGLGGDAEDRLQGESETLAGVERASRAGEDERSRARVDPRALQDLVEADPVGDDRRRGPQPRHRLLRDLAQGVGVSLCLLFLGRARQEPADLLGRAEAGKPVVDGSAEPVHGRRVPA